MIPNEPQLEVGNKPEEVFENIGVDEFKLYGVYYLMVPDELSSSSDNKKSHKKNKKKIQSRS
jgi:hypothetical protein